jgi:hypothetical protein
MPLSKAMDSVLPIGFVVSVSAGETLLLDSGTTLKLRRGQFFVISSYSHPPRTTSLHSMTSNSVNRTSSGLSKESEIGIGVTFGLLTILLVAVLLWLKRGSKREEHNIVSSVKNASYCADKSLTRANLRPKTTTITPPSSTTEECNPCSRPFSFVPSPMSAQFPSAKVFSATNHWANSSPTGHKTNRVLATTVEKGLPVSTLLPVSLVEPASPVDEETIEWMP